MRQLGFPLAPMILGVVLGKIAEVNLSRALAISDDLTLFLTRPWSLFFLIIGLFSIVFPWYQKARGRKSWTLGFLPALCLALSPPLFMMGGIARPAVGGLLIAAGLWLLFSRHRQGWRLDPPEEHEPHLEET
jgi:putative tricarboxylic transport membrane protein